MTTAHKLWPLAGAFMKLKKSICYLEGGEDVLELPLPTFLIEHSNGLVLFDTGLNPDAWDESTRPKYEGVPAVDGYPFICPPGNRVDEQIEKAGFNVGDVTHVVLSHSHLDHTGGLYLFPQAKFYMHEAEVNNTYWGHPYWQSGYGIDDIAKVRSSDWTLVYGSDFDLFGDGSIQLLHTPGHTPGHMSMMVKLPSRTFILGADIGHVKKNLDLIPCPADLDQLASWRSIQRVKHLAEVNKADIWVFHEEADWAQWGQGPHS